MNLFNVRLAYLNASNAKLNEVHAAAGNLSYSYDTVAIAKSSLSQIAELEKALAELRAQIESI